MLSHLTLNTGHVARTGRADVGADIVARLLPILDAAGGPIPGMPGWFLDCMFPLGVDGARLDGGAFFQIADEPGPSRRPVVMAVAAWRADVAASAWDQAMLGYRAMQSPLLSLRLWRVPPQEPPPLPWLAVWLTPFVMLADSEAMQAFGDLGRCVTWALIP